MAHSTRHFASRRSIQRRETPSLQRRVHLPNRTRVGDGSTVPTWDSGLRRGAFMEPSGRNRWQPVANEAPPKTAQTSQSATGGSPRQPFHGKEGVNGSSPLEGFREVPAKQLVLLPRLETLRSGGVH